MEGSPRDKKGPYKRMLQAEWRAAESTKKYAASARYLECNYQSMASPVAIPPLGRKEQVRLGSGLRSLSLCRTGGFWTAADMARAKLIDGDYTDICPCCGDLVLAEGESVAHLLIDCTRWKREREKYLGRFIRQVEDDHHRHLGRNLLAVFLLGGAIGERRIEGWLPPRKGPSSSSREVVAQCCAFEVARFLQSIAHERRKVVRNLSSPRSGAEAQEGMARRTLRRRRR